LEYCATTIMCGPVHKTRFHWCRGNAIQIRREGPFCEKIGEELSIQSSHEKGPSDVF
jgi:hypothetical protein